MSCDFSSIKILSRSKPSNLTIPSFDAVVFVFFVDKFFITVTVSSHSVTDYQQHFLNTCCSHKHMC